MVHCVFLSSVKMFCVGVPDLYDPELAADWRAGLFSVILFPLLCAIATLSAVKMPPWEKERKLGAASGAKSGTV